MIDRDHLRREFAATAGWGQAQVLRLPSDASTRTYYRLRDGGRRALLMDAPPPREKPVEFLHMARLLQGLGYSAPLILAADPIAGFVLVEDLGDDTYTRLIAEGADEHRLYGLAVDLLADLHARFDPTASHGVPPYSDEILLTEAGQFVDWCLPEIAGGPTEPAVKEEYLSLWQAALPLARAVPASLTLRDYHVDNLMWLSDRPGLAACGLLDFQDSLIGPIAYDLVSLLEDARRDVAPTLARAMLARYRTLRPQVDAAALERSMAFLGAQRNAKILGIFCRLARRDGKPVYLKHLPRTWRLLTQSLTHPELAAIKDWMDAHVPPAARGVPAGLSALYPEAVR
ncbi:aminoglycoside phosphotransferase [Aliidongia dinghuensis]|uniref:Aminoglycoside phosphotransferase n=1 Tax=Aliidongia dinghuensis TaxID=1867774 RepID=A0A8J3E3B3_9PROT|nr:phosphotransferase [Aliidongia dinghuensis]GGF28875.1 aminoglycoside phosphotransferase [Aliidongia dinghuensis]